MMYILLGIEIIIIIICRYINILYDVYDIDKNIKNDFFALHSGQYTIILLSKGECGWGRYYYMVQKKEILKNSPSIIVRT